MINTLAEVRSLKVFYKSNFDQLKLYKPIKKSNVCLVIFGDFTIYGKIIHSFRAFVHFFRDFCTFF